VLGTTHIDFVLLQVRTGYADLMSLVVNKHNNNTW